MCGIVGLISSKSSSKSTLQEAISSMTEKIKHRGPDGHGSWINTKSGIAFGHRRLSVIDLSIAGKQPMISSSDRYVITFNGEIYNHLELRKEINRINKEFSWIGSSDTETILALFDLFGVEKAINKLTGMFAFAVFDRKNNLMTLARDRMGEKPLYYGWSNENFFFASELKAFFNVRDSSNSINLTSLNYYLRLMYVPAPLSIFKNIYKLEPGSLIQINCESYPERPLEHDVLNLKNFRNLSFKRWWNIDAYVEHDKFSEKNRPRNYSEDIEDLLSTSIQNQLLSDVPLGAFLSGGVDSSLVTSLMSNLSNKKINSYTIGFESKKFDESSYAREVAKAIGTDHHEEIITAKTARDIIPKLPQIYDEPFADSSQIPTFLVSQFAKTEITVALSGDGADELFGGYNRYTQGAKYWERLFKLPKLSRVLLGMFFHQIPGTLLDQTGSLMNKMYIGSRNYSRLSEKISKVAFYLSEMDSLNEVLSNPVSEWPNNTQLIKGFTNKKSDFNQINSSIFENLNSIEEKMMLLDCKTYLPDDILCKVDRAAMANSLETRTPFLDKNLIEYSLKMPLDVKIRNGTGKAVLRDILYKYVPQNLIERPKMGFAVPIADWLRGPLRDWAETLLDAEKISQQGFLFPEVVNKIWGQHKSGKFDHSAKLWAILNFQAWLEEYNA